MPGQYSPFHTYETGDRRKHIVMSGKQFEYALRFLQQSPVIVFDFETSGLRWFKDSVGVGIGLGGWDAQGFQAFYIPYRHATRENQLDIRLIHRPIGQLLADPSKKKVGHNLKFDIHFARREGWHVAGEFFDTMIAAHLFDENRRIGLKARAEQDLGRKDAGVWEKKISAYVLELARANKIGVKKYRNLYGYSEVPASLCGKYCCHDVEFTALLYQFYESRSVPDKYPRIWKTEMDLLDALVDMEEMGLPINVDYLEGLRGSLKGVLKSLELKIQNTLGVKKEIQLGSDDAVRKLLTDLRCDLKKKTKKDALSVDREVLESFAHKHPVIPMIIEWRDAEKIRSTYTSSILARIDGHNVLHSDFQQVGTNSGRLACKEPNFQNQPVDNNKRALLHSGKKLADGGIDPWSVRRAYVNRGKGWIRQFWDYSQIELRVLAYYSQDPVMLSAYINGEDIHSRTSMEVFGTVDKTFRRLSKVINFGLAYGLTEAGFARQAKIPQEDASRFMSKYFERYYGVAIFRRKFWQTVRFHDCFFQNLFGRPRRVSWIDSTNKWERLSGERQSFATLIQGTAAELTKESIVRIHKYFKAEKIPAYLVATVHDEIQIDCHTDVLEQVARAVKQLMEDYREFEPVPIVADGEYTITSWSDKKGLPI